MKKEDQNMNFKLNEKNGKVKYLNRMNGTVVGSDTTLDSATWLLTHGKPEKSSEFEGYPIAVKMNGNEYFFSGEWMMGGAKDVLGEDKGIEQPERPQKKRRTKDVVLE
jgi:hypothetical protein